MHPQQSHSSFFTQMVEAYGPSVQAPFAQRNRSETAASSYGAEHFRLPSEMKVREQVTSDEVHSRNSILSGIQDRLKSIQSSQAHPSQQQQIYHRPPQGVAQEFPAQYERTDLPYSQSNIHQNPDTYSSASLPSRGLREQSPFSTGVSSSSSHSFARKETNHPSHNVPRSNYDGPGGNGIKNVNPQPESSNDDVLTLQEMAQLRVVEFAVPVKVSAQLEPGGPLVHVCEEATVKLFPRHLVLLRPNGVAAVELVIEELYELNEDEGKCALDCIVQLKGSTSSQLIRIVCSDEVARGAMFKLLSARRTLQEAAKGQR